MDNIGNEGLNEKQILITRAMNIASNINKLEHDNKSLKTLKLAMYKIYNKELVEIRKELEKYEEK